MLKKFQNEFTLVHLLIKFVLQGAGDGEAFNYYEDDDENHFGTFATSRKNPSSHKTSSSIGSNGRKQVCSTGISEKAQGENIMNKQ